MKNCREIGKKIAALDVWDRLLPCNWAIRPKGTVFPYFCLTLGGDERLVRARLLMLEGWQTLHEFVLVRADHAYGFHSSPLEFPHFELVALRSGEVEFFRYDTGYAPRAVNDREAPLLSRILWEAYGLMLRLEGDPKLPLRFADERAIFARVETADGVWEDRPLTIPDPPPHVESIVFAKEVVKKARDLPFAASDALHVDFALVPEVATNEARPRSVYDLKGFSPTEKRLVFDWRVSIPPGGSLKGLWESMPGKVLNSLVDWGKVPGEIKVRSPRVFRMLRPLGLELPFKLSLHDALDFQ